MKVHTMLGFALTVIGAASVSACGGDTGAATGSTCPTTPTLDYENFGQEFIRRQCGACHGAAGAETPKLDTVERVRANWAAIDKAAAAGPDAVNTFMPEGGSVDEAERRKLGEWLACGAP